MKSPTLRSVPLLLAGVLFSACSDPGDKPTTSSAGEAGVATVFPVPAPGDASLEAVRGVVVAFLRAPDWPSRLAHSFGGEALRPEMETYHRGRPHLKWERHSLQLFQIVSEHESGGPYWVMIFSPGDGDPGWPVLVRVEEGKLKVDWSSFMEFADRRFASFRKGREEGPAIFRLVMERRTAYDESDRAALGDLGEFDVYSINPPYGNLGEFEDFAFVPKSSEAGRKLAALLPLGSDSLAVTVSLSKQEIGSGGKRLVVSEFMGEGWFH